MKHLSVVQHTQSEWLGAIEDHLEGRGIRFSYFRPFTPSGKLPDIGVLGDGLILLGGGPWGTTEGAHRLPTLDAEVRLARACLMLAKPVLAFGLGAQILSLAAEGGSVAAPLELSVGEARRIADGALGGLLPARYPNVVYMRDRPRPPDYANLLALDSEGRPAAFQIGQRALGFTAHLGTRRAMLEDLLMEFDGTELGAPPPDTGDSLARLALAGTGIEDALVPLMAGIVGQLGWM